MQNKIRQLIVNDDFFKEEFNYIELKKEIGEIKKFKFYLHKEENILLKITGSYNRCEEQNITRTLIEKQKNFKEIDFPIGEIINNNNYIGQMQTYYPIHTTLYELKEYYYLKKIIEIYKKSDEPIENIMILLKEILILLEKLTDNNIYYLDIHPKNFLIVENNIKLIDYESEYVFFNDEKGKLIKCIKYNYATLVHNVLEGLDLYNKYPNDIYTKTFEEHHKELVKIENKIRRGY